LGAIPDTSISGRRVARELTAIVERRGKPAMIVSDHGTEFTCNAMLAWSKDTVVDWHFITPGKPMQNGFIESFNGLIMSCCRSKVTTHFSAALQQLILVFGSGRLRFVLRH
jgi:transposase InsO family protein